MTPSGIDLYWLPLGAGGHSIRWNGRLFEAVVALRERRTVRELYHSALKVDIAQESYAIEMTPVWGAAGVDRGVVAEGPVGAAWAGRWRMFRYEVHSWRGGSIGDVAEAVASPKRLTSDESTCRRLLRLLPTIPTPAWGRDELGTGDMWNSNSVVSWALARSGLDVMGIRPPTGGGAPGWDAGVIVERRGR